MTGFPLPLKTIFRKRRRDDNEEDNHDDPHSKRNKKDQAFQDPHAIEVGAMATQLLHLTHCQLSGIHFHLHVGKRTLPDTLMKVFSLAAMVLRQSRILSVVISIALLRSRTETGPIEMFSKPNQEEWGSSNSLTLQIGRENRTPASMVRKDINLKNRVVGY